MFLLLLLTQCIWFMCLHASVHPRLWVDLGQKTVYLWLLHFSVNWVRHIVAGQRVCSMKDHDKHFLTNLIPFNLHENNSRELWLSSVFFEMEETGSERLVSCSRSHSSDTRTRIYFFSASETHVFLTTLCYIIITHSFLRDGMYIENKKELSSGMA